MIKLKRTWVPHCGCCKLFVMVFFIVLLVCWAYWYDDAIFKFTEKTMRLREHEKMWSIFQWECTCIFCFCLFPKYIIKDVTWRDEAKKFCNYYKSDLPVMEVLYAQLDTWEVKWKKFKEWKNSLKDIRHCSGNNMFVWA